MPIGRYFCMLLMLHDISFKSIESPKISCIAKCRSRINFRVLQNFTEKIYYNKMRQIKGILLIIISTEAASKRECHGTDIGSQTK